MTKLRHVAASAGEVDHADRLRRIGMLFGELLRLGRLLCVGERRGGSDQNGGGFNLPIWMTQRQGFFAAEKIDVKIDFTPGSTYQLTHLIAGTYDMGFTAIDNIIAYREGQNEAYLPPGTNVDLIAVLASFSVSALLTENWRRPPRVTSGLTEYLRLTKILDASRPTFGQTGISSR